MITQLYVKATTFLTEFKNDERGVTAIEYGLIGVAMAVALTAIFFSDTGGLMANLKAAFGVISDNLKDIVADNG
ncbi:Flp family type IVb pilin [Vibrio sp. FNV 38]|nr:Flp family type IVb pilin [Vibrio sp. FNV 38]